MMATLTQDADHHLQSYLRRVKAALRPHRSVDVTDVERDVMCHIEAALAGHPAPVDAGTLLPILNRLGSPSTWVPDEELPAWRRVLTRMRSGPEDWRLAYLTITMLFLGLTLPIEGTDVWLLKPALIALSVVTARASLSLLAEYDEPVGARRWLLYPPLVPVYVAVLLVTLFWPGPVAGVAASEAPMRAMLGRLGYSPYSAPPLLGTMAMGVWWMALGIGLAARSGIVRACFYPFAERVGRRHGVMLSAAGVVLALGAGLTLVVFAR